MMGNPKFNPQYIRYPEIRRWNIQVKSVMAPASFIGVVRDEKNRIQGIIRKDEIREAF